jgi:hypothetical protein
VGVNERARDARILEGDVAVGEAPTLRLALISRHHHRARTRDESL